MSELLGNRLFTALDADGRVISGARASFFLAGTTTPADVYQDGALTTPHAQPVVADSAGRFPDVYLDPAVSYRMDLDDAELVAVHSIDPVSQAGVGGLPATPFAVDFIGANNASDALQVLGLVDASNPLNITAATTLGADALNRLIVISDSGMPAD